MRFCFREIGHYKHSSQWNTKFYQSLVAVQKLKLSKKLKGHEGCVNSLDFNSAGDLIASGSDDFKICLWKWSEGTCILKHNSKHTKNIFQVNFLHVHVYLNIYAHRLTMINVIYFLLTAIFY